MTTAAEYERALTGVLEENGITDYEIRQRRKHKVLVFRHRSVRMNYFFPSSPSDRRGVKNAETQLRRVMGVERKTNKNPNRRRKTKTHRPVECPVITAKPDPFEKLAALKTAHKPKLTWWQRLKQRIRKRSLAAASGEEAA